MKLMNDEETKEMFLNGDVTLDAIEHPGQTYEWANTRLPKIVIISTPDTCSIFYQEKWWTAQWDEASAMAEGDVRTFAREIVREVNRGG